MSLDGTILYDPFFHTMLLGPLSGFVLGKLMSESKEHYTPKEKLVAITASINVNYNHTTHNHYHYRQSSDDGGVVVFGAAIVLLVSFWAYVCNLELIVSIFEAVAYATSFSLVSIVTACIFKKCLTVRWLAEFVLLGLIVSLSFYWVKIPLQVFTLEDIQQAQALPFWDYWKTLTDYGRHIIFAHIVGMVSIGVALFLTCFRCIHFIFLVIAVPTQYSLSSRIALKTSGFGGSFCTFFLFVLCLFGWFFMDESKDMSGLYWQLLGHIRGGIFG